MAISNARHLRPLLAVAGLLAVLIAVPAIAVAAPNSQLTADQVQKKLGALVIKNSQLVDKYDQARTATVKAKKEAAAARVKASALESSYRSSRSQYVKLVQAQYEGGTFGAAGALLESDSNSDYMQRMSSLGMMSSHVAQVVQAINLQQSAAAKASAAAHSSYVAAKAKSDALNTQRLQITAQVAKYRALLRKLNAQQRTDFLRAQNPSVARSSIKIPTVTSGAAQKAVTFAYRQLGKPYVWGAAGPNAYDCSGLTMAAWAAAGVSLPHSAAQQYNYGTHVSLNDLTPGDLIFMYQPIGHVTIYIGDGYMISAPTEGENVMIVPVSAFSSDIVGATHLG